MKLLPLFATVLSTMALASPQRVINGKEVHPGFYPEVAEISVNSARCSATFIGPRVFVTAAHCAVGGTKVEVHFGPGSAQGTLFPHPDYPARDHDLAVGVLDAGSLSFPYTCLEPQRPALGDWLGVVGFGCTQPGGGDAGQRRLHRGDVEVVDFSGHDMVTTGAAVCFGDSGGPLYREYANRSALVGLHSKGNVKDRSWHTDLTSSESREFIRQVVESQKAWACGLSRSEGPTPVRPAGFEF